MRAAQKPHRLNLPDGRFVLRTYAAALVYSRPGHQIGSAPLPLQPQGESVAVNGARLLVGSEGSRSAVYDVPVPVATGSEPAPSAPTAGSSGVPSDESSASRTAYRAAGFAAVLVVLVGVLGYLHRGRRSRRA